MTQASQPDSSGGLAEAYEAALRRIEELEEQVQKLEGKLVERPALLDELTDPVLRERVSRLGSPPPDTLIREAGVVLEDRLRTLGGVGAQFGVKLVDAVLDPVKGTLQFSSHRGEQDGVRMLYRGAMQFIRNPPMHGLVEYQENTARQLIRLIDALLQLLSEHASSGANEYSLQDRYSYITNRRAREQARKLVDEIQSWYPERVSVVPTKSDISLRIPGRVFAVLTPRRAFFNVYTYNDAGEWTRYKIESESDVDAVRSLARARLDEMLSRKF